VEDDANLVEQLHQRIMAQSWWSDHCRWVRALLQRSLLMLELVARRAKKKTNPPKSVWCAMRRTRCGVFIHVSAAVEFR
jgi:hypothetical protein